MNEGFFIFLICQGFAKQAAGGAKRRQFRFKPKDVITDTLYAATGVINTEATFFEVLAVTVPDDDVPAGDSGLLKSFAHCIDQCHRCRIPLTGQAVYLEADHFVGPRHHLPGLDGVVPVKPGHHRPIQQRGDAVGVE